MPSPYLALALQHGLLTPAQVEAWKRRGAAPEGEPLLQALRADGLLDGAELDLLRRLAADTVEMPGAAAPQVAPPPATQISNRAPHPVGPVPSPAPGTVTPLSQAGDEALPAQEMPRQIGRYRILGVLGRGGMGVVYRAEDPQLRRIVALKALTGGAFATLDQVQRFQREARMAARLSHPNIVRVIDVGTEGELQYYTMDLVRGESLDTWLARKRGSLRPAVEVLATVADALHHAHRNGVVHRDIKPGNILVDEEGRPYLTDFGLGREQDAQTAVTVSGTVMGTPAYMPPEQAAGNLREIDERSDVYSLGAVLYQALTGSPPFDAESIGEVLRQVIEDEPRPPHRRDPSIPHDLGVIAMKCLDKEKTRRYGSAEELADDLRRFLRDEPVRARPVSRIHRMQRWVRRHVWLARALAVAFLLFLLLAISMAGPSRLRLATVPPDAQVTFDGEPLGSGWVWPMSGAGLIAPEKTFTLRVRAPGYEPYEVVVPLRGFTFRDLGTIRLLPDHALLSADTRPSGAGIWLDGAATGQRTPVRDLRLANGRHYVRFVLPAHALLELPVRAMPGEALDLGVLPLAGE